jgi:nitric oxide synthase-interacting protein
MAQRKEIKRLEKEWEAEEIEREEGERLAREEQHKREVEDFERVSQGLEGTGNKSWQNGKKRKAEEMHAGDARAKERRKGEDRGTEASFWVPGVDISEMDGHNAKKPKPEKLAPLCPASTPDTKHTYSLKTLVTVVFTEDQDSKTKEMVRICPSCKKGLSNSSRAMLAKPCGHVLCGSCVDQFMRPPDHEKAGTKAGEEVVKVLCYVCETDLTEKRSKAIEDRVRHKDKDKLRPGLSEFNCEGTGFAGGGTNVATRAGVAFQC